MSKMYIYTVKTKNIFYVVVLLLCNIYMVVNT